MIWGHNLSHRELVAVFTLFTQPSSSCKSRHYKLRISMLQRPRVKNGLGSSHVKGSWREREGNLTPGLWRGENLMCTFWACFWPRFLLDKGVLSHSVPMRELCPSTKSGWSRRLVPLWWPSLTQVYRLKKPAYLILRCTLPHQYLLYKLKMRFLTERSRGYIDQSVSAGTHTGFKSWLSLHQVHNLT